MLKRCFVIGSLLVLGIAALFFIAQLEFYGAWTTLLVDVCLVPLIIFVYDRSKAWRYWLLSVLIGSYLIMVASSFNRVIHKDGRIQVVPLTYPILNKVYIEGVSIDTIRVAAGYGTFAGWFYNVTQCDIYAIRDTADITIIITAFPGHNIKGKNLTIEEYDEGKHGTINYFSYINDDGVRERRDYYGASLDSESYTVHVYDNAEYIPDYIP